MEELGNALFLDDVPESWTRRAYPSMSGLAAWFVDLLLRIKELESWTSDFCLPNVVWLSGFFNPQSFLTAIEQSMARKNEWPLDKMALQVNYCYCYVIYFSRRTENVAIFCYGLVHYNPSCDLGSLSRDVFERRT